MDTFDDRNHTRTANEFLKPGPEDIATVKTKAKAERVSINGYFLSTCINYRIYYVITPFIYNLLFSSLNLRVLVFTQ